MPHPLERTATTETIESASSDDREDRHAFFGWPLAIAALAALLQLPSLWASFIADDYVLRATTGRVDSPWWAFTHNDLGQPRGSGHFYRPIWILTNWSLRHLAGDRAALYHAFSIMLFGLVAAGVWYLARTIADGPTATIAALTFAVYPRHGETVAWISANTDLIAAAFVLASLLAAVCLRGAILRTAVSLAFAVAAVMTKEVAYALPLLALIVLLGRVRLGRERERQVVWLLPCMLLLMEIGAFAWRWHVLGGLGGEEDHPWSLRRMAASAASYVAAGLSAPQVDLLAHPAFAILLVLLVAAAAFAAFRRRSDSALVVCLVAGLAWIVVTVAPQLNIGLNLRTANGDRLLFVPSIGLALIVGVLLGGLRVTRRQLTALTVAAALAATLTVADSIQWVRAGKLAQQLVDEAYRLAPPNGKGELLILSIPENYRQARVMPLGLDQALLERGATWRTAWCSQTQVLERKAGTVVFKRAGANRFDGTATRDSPFTVPLSGGAPLPLTPDCSYEASGQRTYGRGWTAAVVIDAHPLVNPVKLVFFDGDHLRRWP